jgi:hypothetical protein
MYFYSTFHYLSRLGTNQSFGLTITIAGQINDKSTPNRLHSSQYAAISPKKGERERERENILLEQSQHQIFFLPLPTFLPIKSDSENLLPDFSDKTQQKNVNYAT